MCCAALPEHEGTEPPPGEQWCPMRLAIELQRWLEGYPMTCGPVFTIGTRDLD